MVIIESLKHINDWDVDYLTDYMYRSFTHKESNLTLRFDHMGYSGWTIYNSAFEPHEIQALVVASDQYMEIIYDKERQSRKRIEIEKKNSFMELLKYYPYKTGTSE